MRPFEIKKILVPVDFSPVSLNALKTAIAICKRQLATLTLIHVVEIPYSYTIDSGRMLNSMLPKLVKIANENLSVLTREVSKDHDIPVSYAVQSGNPADEISRWAYDYEKDLIVMGTHGNSDLREFFLGSNSYRVVKSAPCPVMTIPDGDWPEFKKILFPIRMIPNTLDKYDVVRPIADRNNSLMLVAGVAMKNDYAAANEMEALVEFVRQNISKQGIICGSEVHYCEDITRQVLSIADAEKPDLLVITATLEESIKDFFVGPYTQGIVNHSRFPVLSIRPSLSNRFSSTLPDQIVNDFNSLYQGYSPNF